MIFINILICIQFLLVIYVRAFLTPCLCSSEVENYMLLFSLFMFKHSIHKNNLPHNVYVRAESRTFCYASEVENPVLLYSLFMFERSREPCATCLRSSGVENLALPVYVRAESRTFLTPCLSSSEAENPALLVYVRAESRTFCYASGVENPALLFSLFMFERSREPS